MLTGNRPIRPRVFFGGGGERIFNLFTLATTSATRLPSDRLFSTGSWYEGGLGQGQDVAKSNEAAAEAVVVVLREEESREGLREDEESPPPLGAAAAAAETGDRRGPVLCRARTAARGGWSRGLAEQGAGTVAAMVYLQGFVSFSQKRKPKKVARRRRRRAGEVAPPLSSLFFLTYSLRLRPLSHSFFLFSCVCMRLVFFLKLQMYSPPLK